MHRNLTLILFMLAVILAGVLLATALHSDSPPESAQAALEPGLAFLEAQEQKDPGEVEDILKELRRQRLIEEQLQKKQEEARQQEAEAQERVQQLLSDSANVWSLFEDYAILGDSRAVGFWYYGYLPESRVLSASGASILTIPDWTPQLVALNPSYVFLCFGLNDLSYNFWPTPEEYAARYESTLQTLQAAVPNARIFVVSILPVQEDAIDDKPLWRSIPEYNEALKKMCEETGFPFVDNDNLSETHPDLWADDDIHFDRAFYPYWATNLIAALYEDQLKA